MSTQDNPRAALWRMIAGAALISTTSIFVRYAHVPPTVSAFYRLAFGSIMLCALLCVRGDWRGLRWRDVAALILPALAFAVDLIVWHRSILYVGPGLATLLGNFQVFVMAVAGVMFYRERIGWRFALGLALAFVGLWLMIGRNWAGLSGDYRLGVWLGILTGISYAIYMLSQRRAQLHHAALTPLRALTVVSVLTAVFLGIAVVIEGDSFAIPDAQSWAALLALALFGQVLGWMLISQAMPRLPASLVGLLLLLQPALSFVLDVILFARPTVGTDWIGLALSLFGIFVASRRG